MALSLLCLNEMHEAKSAQKNQQYALIVKALLLEKIGSKIEYKLPWTASGLCKGIFHSAGVELHCCSPSCTGPVGKRHISMVS